MSEFNYHNESTTARNIINVAATLIKGGVGADIAIPAANVIKFNDELIKRINALKQIDILDIATRSYLYGIQLTDNVLQVEPKVNAIWTLVKTAGLIDDSALSADIPTTTTDDDTQQVASDIIEKILIQN